MKHKKIELSPVQKTELAKTLQAYFADERDEQLGDLAAQLMLQFITEQIAPAYYNQGVYDAYRYIQERNEDILALQKD